QQPRERGVERADRAFRRAGVPHHRAAQRSPGRGTQPWPEHRRLRQVQPRRHRLHGTGRRTAAPPARTWAAGHRRPPDKNRSGDRRMSAEPPKSPAAKAPASKTAAKKRGLGRGLEALLGPGAASQAPALEATAGDRLRTLPVDALVAGRYQPRQHWDEDKLSELGASIRAQGVIQPIVVGEIDGPDGRGSKVFEIIAGERRWRASRQAGLAEVPVVVREVDDRTMVAMALIENIQREDLNPLEEAQALQRLIDEFDLTHAQAADAV